MIGARGRDRKCQEASPLSRSTFVACGKDAVCIVDNGDTHPYWMCAECAVHNVENRGAVRWQAVSYEDEVELRRIAAYHAEANR